MKPRSGIKGASMKIITLVLSMMLMSNVAFSEEEEEKRHERGEFLKKELGLSDEQLAKVKEIRKSSKDGMKENKAQFKQLKKDFKEAMKNPNSTNEELNAKFEYFQKARDDFQRKRFATMLKMREVMTPEQLAKFHELKQKHKGKWRKDKSSKKKK